MGGHETLLIGLLRHRPPWAKFGLLPRTRPSLRIMPAPSGAEAPMYPSIPCLEGPFVPGRVQDTLAGRGESAGHLTLALSQLPRPLLKVRIGIRNDASQSGLRLAPDGDQNVFTRRRQLDKFGEASLAVRKVDNHVTIVVSGGGLCQVGWKLLSDQRVPRRTWDGDPRGSWFHHRAPS